MILRNLSLKMLSLFRNIRIYFVNQHFLQPMNFIKSKSRNRIDDFSLESPQDVRLY